MIRQVSGHINRCDIEPSSDVLIRLQVLPIQISGRTTEIFIATFQLVYMPSLAENSVPSHTRCYLYEFLIPFASKGLGFCFLKEEKNAGRKER
jgi:hypothetical protein